MDDDIASLNGLLLIVDPACRYVIWHVGVLRLSLSLYLMTQCQIKLRHSVTSLAQTLDYVEVTRRRRLPQLATLGQLLLKFTERKILSYMHSTF